MAPGGAGGSGIADTALRYFGVMKRLWLSTA
jgi:hypothetical protein